jgi:hypothetical protein
MQHHSDATDDQVSHPRLLKRGEHLQQVARSPAAKLEQPLCRFAPRGELALRAAHKIGSLD